MVTNTQIPLRVLINVLNSVIILSLLQTFYPLYQLTLFFYTVCLWHFSICSTLFYVHQHSSIVGWLILSREIDLYYYFTAQKWIFPSRISSVNVNKNCGFGHIYWRNLLWKNSFFVHCTFHCVKSVRIWSLSWSVLSRICTEYRDLQSTYSYSASMQENKEQKKIQIWTLFTPWHTFRFLEFW